MYLVTIVSPEVREFSYTDKQGRPAKLRTQQGYLHYFLSDGKPSTIPDRFEMLLERDQVGYAAGEYQLHPSAVHVDRNGRLACATRLTPKPVDGKR